LDRQILIKGVVSPLGLVAIRFDLCNNHRHYRVFIGAAHVRILYLEDSQADVALIRQYMTSVNHQFSAADSLEDAKKHLDAQSPDIFLVDIVIGNETAYDLISYTAKQRRAKHIIALTAKALPDEREHCFELGCTEVLSKPFTIDDLENAINQLD
jgi:CheY-like chemotaxis protein